MWEIIYSNYLFSRHAAEFFCPCKWNFPDKGIFGEDNSETQMRDRCRLWELCKLPAIMGSCVMPEDGIPPIMSDWEALSRRDGHRGSYFLQGSLSGSKQLYRRKHRNGNTWRCLLPIVKFLGVQTEQLNISIQIRIALECNRKNFEFNSRTPYPTAGFDRSVWSLKKPSILWMTDRNFFFQWEARSVKSLMYEWVDFWVVDVRRGTEEVIKGLWQITIIVELLELTE